MTFKDLLFAIGFRKGYAVLVNHRALLLRLYKKEEWDKERQDLHTRFNDWLDDPSRGPHSMVPVSIGGNRRLSFSRLSDAIEFKLLFGDEKFLAPQKGVRWRGLTDDFS